MQNYIDSLKEHIEKRELLSILQNFQNKFGYIDLNFIEQLSKRINVPAGKIYGIASFYNQFRFKPKGRHHIKICSGAACHIKTKDNLTSEIYKILNLKNKETSSDGKFSIEFIPCMGACALGPIIAVNDRYFMNVSLNDFKIIISNLD
ncbi:MAG: NAD(P)H-dependent oxidoreductase subunit E [Bacteroidales bacterium]|nr:NAD(P)H-dependent oxidoreductase subunit E [Bacteroidales bacterium]